MPPEDAQVQLAWLRVAPFILPDAGSKGKRDHGPKEGRACKSRSKNGQHIVSRMYAGWAGPQPSVPVAFATSWYPEFQQYDTMACAGRHPAVHSYPLRS
jgi:hypothetical protein